MEISELDKFKEYFNTREELVLNNLQETFDFIKTLDVEEFAYFLNKNGITTPLKY